jgi:exoribonuclease R
MLKGKIIMNTSMIGIKNLLDDSFLKLGMKDLASQVIDEDIVDFSVQNQQGIVHKIIERRKQPFIGMISKVTPKTTYLHLPLLNPCSSVPVNLQGSNYGANYKVGDWVVGWIDIQKCEVVERSDQIKSMIQRFHKELLKMNIPYVQPQLQEDQYPIKDLTHLSTFHIDPPGCIDIDDLMSIDLSNNKVYIHIIDITKYISIGSEEDLFGLCYGNTWYLPNMSDLHLYPNASQIYDRPLSCITMEITFKSSKEGDEQNNEDLVDVNFYKSIVELKYHFTYFEVQEIFEGKEHPLTKELNQSLKWIRNIYLPKESMMRRLHWKFNEDKISIVFDQELLAHRFINGWMVFYNSWVGQNIRVNGQLLPQRHHPETSIRSVFQEDSQIPKEVQHLLQVKEMRQAEYMNKAGHFGLQRNFYTHMTSPLRRYFDRWVQYMWTFNFSIECQELLDHLNRMERISERVSDWYHKQILFQYVDQNKNKEWEAYVVKIHPRGIEWYLYELQEFIYVNQSEPFSVLGEKSYLKLQVDRKSIPKLQIC